MAYQEEVGTSPDDVINKIAVFAQANGWTVDRNTLSGSNRTLTVHKSGDYIHIYNINTTRIFMRGSVGYNAANPPSTQPNVSNAATCSPEAGPYTKIYMFADDLPTEHVFIVIETAGGILYHLCFGMIEKFGTFTGGTFFDASCWTRSTSQVYTWNSSHHALFDSGQGSGFSSAEVGGSIRCDIPADGLTNNWARLAADTAGSNNPRIQCGLNAGTSESSNEKSWLTTLAYSRNDPPFSGQPSLGTIRAHVVREGTSDFWSPIGTIPNIRYLRMQRYSSGQEITIGTDVWKIFPMARYGVGTNNGSPNNVFSEYHGYAYKKVV